MSKANGRYELILEESQVQVQSLKVKEDLNLKIWDRDNEYKMHPEIRKKLLDVAEYFISYCDFESFGIDLKIEDIILTGSLANYNWSVYSDLDVHIIVDTTGIDDVTRSVLMEYFSLRKKIFAEQHDIRVASYEVELYMQDLQETREKLVALGIYSLKNDAWLKFPEKYEKDVEWETVRKKSIDYMSLIDELEKTISFGSIKSYDAMLQKLYDVWRRVKEERRAGLEEAGEFAIGNLIFKVLRRNGYIQKIMDMRSKLVSQKLSLK